MARGFYIAGPCVVKVKGMAGTNIESVSELGLTKEAVQIIPRVFHRDVKVDDFGGEDGPPPEVLAWLGECYLRMTLVHFDTTILKTCVAESMGGGTFGTLAGCGIPLGAYKDRFAAGNHFISVNIINTTGNTWSFKSCYTPQTPVEWPVGSERSEVRMIWRVIPYTNPGGSTSPSELVSSGVVLFDTTPDTD